MVVHRIIFNEESQNQVEKTLSLGADGQAVEYLSNRICKGLYLKYVAFPLIYPSFSPDNITHLSLIYLSRHQSNRLT